MIVVGITGNIATGKTFISDYLITKNYSVFCADRVSRNSYLYVNIYKQIHQIFPESQNLLGDDLRNYLSKFIFADKEKLILLEKIIQPYVRQEMISFIKFSKEAKKELIFVDVALLYEKKLEEIFDYVIVTDSKNANIKQRLEMRSYDKNKINDILNIQLDQNLKKSKADFVIDTNNSKEETINQLNKILKKLCVK